MLFNCLIYVVKMMIIIADMLLSYIIYINVEKIFENLVFPLFYKKIINLLFRRIFLDQFVICKKGCFALLQIFC